MGLELIVDDYIRRYRASAQEELQWFRSQPDLETAVDVAARAVDHEGKRYSHQYKIRADSISSARQSLAKNLDRIKGAPNFGVLLRTLNEILGPTDGVAELYVYDCALRIGAFVGHLPKQIFLHAGTRDGARALGLKWKERFLYISDLPDELRVLEPYEIEDVLCIYKDKFALALGGRFTPPEFTWCYPQPREE